MQIRKMPNPFSSWPSWSCIDIVLKMDSPVESESIGMRISCAIVFNMWQLSLRAPPSHMISQLHLRKVTKGNPFSFASFVEAQKLKKIHERLGWRGRKQSNTWHEKEWWCEVGNWTTRSTWQRKEKKNPFRHVPKGTQFYNCKYRILCIIFKAWHVQMSPIECRCVSCYVV